MAMRAAYLTGHGGNEVVCIGERPVPSLHPGHVLVEMAAATLNQVDLYMRNSGAGITHSIPQILGVDGAGIVVQAAEQVTGWQAGDSVTLYPAIGCAACEYCARGETMFCLKVRYLGEHRDGTFARYVSVPAANLFRLPPHLDYAQGAALGVAWLTAWRMVITQAKLRPGETVLIFGIGGGVSQAAMHIALRSGARVLVTSRDADKRAMALAAGAEYAFPSGPEAVEGVMACTAGRGADVVIENVGQALWPFALRSLARGGRLVTCGATSGDAPSAELRRLFVRQLQIIGSTLGTPGEFAELLRFVEINGVIPAIESRFPLHLLHSAFDRIEAGEQCGKLAVEIAGLAGPVTPGKALKS